MQSNEAEMFRVHDRTIPSRRERLNREHERNNEELIRQAMQSSASEAAQREEDCA